MYTDHEFRDDFDTLLEVAEELKKYGVDSCIDLPAKQIMVTVREEDGYSEFYDEWTDPQSAHEFLGQFHPNKKWEDVA